MDHPRGGQVFLSTPSARRATGAAVQGFPAEEISIHALREEGDHGSLQHDHDEPISIHALREEGDLWDALRDAARNDFYPRPPRGGRQDALDFLFEVLGFLSTPSARRATPAAENKHAAAKFLSTPSARRATTSRSQ